MNKTVIPTTINTFRSILYWRYNGGRKGEKEIKLSIFSGDMIVYMKKFRRTYM